MSGARFGRTVILARDLDAIGTAYREAFGWSTLADVDAGPGRRYLHVGPDEQPGVGVWFLVPEDAAGRDRVGAQTGGEPLLVLYVDDLDGVLRSAVAAGFGADDTGRGSDATSSWAHVRDPLGNGLVLVRLGTDRASE